MHQSFSLNRSHAEELDRRDELKDFRQRFFIPDRTLYMDGNSLGLLSRDAESSMLRVLSEWRKLAIKGWLDAEKPWFYFAETLGAMASGLVGAKPGEVILTVTATVNIHALLAGFFKPETGRNKILADVLNFPSDIYALKGQLKLHGLNPETHLIRVPSADGFLLDEEEIVKYMQDDVAFIWLPSVLYSSGQLLDMEYLTREAHKRNILIGFDCCHSAGAVPHEFDRWGVDVAVFCSYKYLNGGPGANGFLYVNARHHEREPLLAGWFGNKKASQFGMSHDFEPADGAGGWQITAPAIVSSASMEGSLKLINEAGIDRIRHKSLAMTQYLTELIQRVLTDEPYGFRIVTPLEEHRRGGHVSIRHPEESYRICEALRARGVIPDFRPPDMIRIAPVALYNTFTDVWDTVMHLKTIIDKREYEAFSSVRREIS